MTDKAKVCDHSWIKAGVSEPNVHQCFHCGEWHLIGRPHTLVGVSFRPPAGFEQGVMDGMRFVEETK